MTRKLHIQRIVDTLISLEKNASINVLIDANLSLLRWGLYLKTHLELQRHNLYSSSYSHTNLIGLQDDAGKMKESKAALYDEILEYSVVDYITTCNPQYDIFLLLSECSRCKVTLATLKQVLNAAKVGVIVNLNENVLDIPPYSYETISYLTELDNNFDLVEITNKVFFFKRKYQCYRPIYLFDAFESEDNSVALTNSSSIVEYLIPENKSFVKISLLKHPWSGEVSVSIDGNQILNEVLECDKTITDFDIIIKLPLNESRLLTFRSLHSSERLGNEVWIRDVQFS